MELERTFTSHRWLASKLGVLESGLPSLVSLPQLAYTTFRPLPGHSLPKFKYRENQPVLILRSFAAIETSKRFKKITN